MSRARDDIVVFDLGGVVCRFHPDRRLRVRSDVTGLSTRRLLGPTQ